VQVETYPVDVDAEQVVLWLLDEERLHAFDLLVRTTRSYQRSALAESEDSRLGDTEREDLGENAEVGLVEVRPRRRPSLWALRIRVVDDIGPALPDDEPVPAGEEEIDLPTFYDEFIKADRGLSEVSAEVEGPGAEGSLTRVLDAMRKDRHKYPKM
jgi:hypothetical protein